MKNLLFAILSLLALSSYCQGTNIISIWNGASFVETPASYVENTERMLHAKFSPGALFDETTNPWCSAANPQFPLTFVMELVEEYNIHQLLFDNRVENYNGIDTKAVEVYFSNTSSSSGFALAGSYELLPNRINTYSINGNARWIKLVIKSNYGTKDYVELAEFKAFGSPTKKLAQAVNIEGTWKTNWQNTYFTQVGNTFTGSYKYGKVKGKVLNGTINRNTLEFDWDEGRLKGNALLYLNEEGNRISGLWQNGLKATDYGLWTMYRDDPVSISYEEKTVEAKGYIDGEEITLEKRFVLKNVLFVRAQAKLLPGSFEELDQLVEYLLANEQFLIELSGHTDNRGNRESNIELSEKRVQTVKEYLISRGVNKKRISGKGYGPDQPIADNNSEETRKLNRRVEFTLHQ
jgi:outer membrane protein OmpA-like peptidoglycan-associated protein